jgi:hypothetical protein
MKTNKRYKETTLQKTVSLVDEILHTRDSHNIERELARVALSSTVSFICKNLPTVVPVTTREELLSQSLHSVKIDGLFLEFGVGSGRSINVIASLLDEGRTVYGFDSFEGLPEDWRAGFPQGRFKVRKPPRVRRNVQLVKGLFQDTLPGFLQKQEGNVAFLHVDSDLYSSAKTIFDSLDHRIVKGTVIVFDEYFNYFGWEEHEHKAFREFMASGNRSVEYLGYCKFGQQLAVRMR